MGGGGGGGLIEPFWYSSRDLDKQDFAARGKWLKFNLGNNKYKNTCQDGF